MLREGRRSFLERLEFHDLLECISRVAPNSHMLKSVFEIGQLGQEGHATREGLG